MIGGCDSNDNTAYACVGQKEKACYDTSNIGYLPPPIDDDTFPLYNVTAWKDNLSTCGVYPTPQGIDNYCDYGRGGFKNMTFQFKSFVEKYANDPRSENDPVLQTMDQFRQAEPSKMRQSLLGYNCLPSATDPRTRQRAQGYRYVHFPLNSGHQSTGCSMVDCLDVALTQGVQNVYYDEESGGCSAVVCEGDGCTQMTPSSPSAGPAKKFASRGPDGAYCKKSPSTVTLDQFKHENCPKDVSLDCLPDSDQDGQGKSDVEEVYLKNGLQYWRPGQRTLHQCMFDSNSEYNGDYDLQFWSKDLIAQIDYPLPKPYPNPGPERPTKCIDPLNSLDYVGSPLSIQPKVLGEFCPMAGCTPNCPPLVESFDNLPETETELLGIKDYSTKILWNVNGYNQLPWQQCESWGSVEKVP